MLENHPTVVLSRPRIARPAPAELHGPARAQRRRRLRPGVRWRLGTLVLLCALMLALVLAVPGLEAVRKEIAHLDPGLVALAVALEVASCVSFVVVFRLFFDRLPAGDARLLAWSEEGSGALLPGGGAGGLAIGGWLIHLTGASTAWIVRRTGALFLLGSAVNGAALIICAAALMAGAAGPGDFARGVLPGVVAAALTVVTVALPPMLRTGWQAPRWLRGLGGFVQEAERIAFRRPSWRLLGAVGYLQFDMAVLAICLKAVGATPSLLAVILAYNLGYLASALPVPGGIGVLDAGLVGALVLYGVSPTHAAAAVLVYRAIALWIPGLGGLLAYLRLRPRLTR